MAKILIVVAPYYKEITDALIEAASRIVHEKNYQLDILQVPGAFEIPAAIKMANDMAPYAGYIALGCVIRGETSHYDYVCEESARGLQDLALNHKLAIGYGILTVENRQQALARAQLHGRNKGEEAARACLRMIEVKQQFAA